ncbi:hypothetical protein GY45DRAFT_767627 [Cubamyces sp. BRFM 1775]|nr:hypothetical protein GY45DRAFT_767627 [Cubamyces sp. BRFM 1775]
MLAPSLAPWFPTLTLGVDAAHTLAPSHPLSLRCTILLARVSSVMIVLRLSRLSYPEAPVVVLSVVVSVPFVPVVMSFRISRRTIPRTWIRSSSLSSVVIVLEAGVHTAVFLVLHNPLRWFARPVDHVLVSGLTGAVDPKLQACTVVEMTERETGSLHCCCIGRCCCAASLTTPAAVVAGIERMPRSTVRCLRMSSRTPGTRQCVTAAQVRFRSPAHMCGADAPIGEHRAARLIRLQKQRDPSAPFSLLVPRSSRASCAGSSKWLWEPRS